MLNIEKSSSAANKTMKDRESQIFLEREVQNLVAVLRMQSRWPQMVG